VEEFPKGTKDISPGWTLSEREGETLG